ncbi:hypothetical protein [Agrobacterium tumefaciens]|uniref:hypothetical protein n=1 Tax=Agrobacterium tumefaciens TaxID=358 RepID=UPI001663F66D
MRVETGDLANAINTNRLNGGRLCFLHEAVLQKRENTAAKACLRAEIARMLLAKMIHANKS